MAVDRKTFVVLGRLSFPSIFTPRTNINEKGEVTQAYEAQLIVRKDEPSLGTLADQCAALLKDKHGAKVPPNIARGLRDGSEKPDIAGMSDEVMFFTAKSKHKPPVVDNRKVGITDSDSVWSRKRLQILSCSVWAKASPSILCFPTPPRSGRSS